MAIEVHLRFSHGTDSLSPDDEADSESVCSSQDGSVLSEDGAGGRAEEVAATEEDVQFLLSEHVDNLSDKRLERGRGQNRQDDGFSSLIVHGRGRKRCPA